MEAALQRLQKTIATGRLKDRHKRERRLGKIQARHPSVNHRYEVSLRDTAEGVRLSWQMKDDRKTWRESREGPYLLRTNIRAGTAKEWWSKYMQLTEAEASFRALKSELSIRPLFHQLEPRVKAHVMVAFLGYALWVTLKHLLRRRPASVVQPSASGVENTQPLSPSKALALLSTPQSADIVLPTTDGREIRLRRITEPTAEQRSQLQQLGVSLGLNRVELTEDNFDDTYSTLVGQYNTPVALQAYPQLKLAQASSPSNQSGATGSGQLYLNTNEDAELNTHLPAARDTRLSASVANAAAPILNVIPDVHVELHYWGLGAHTKVFGGDWMAAAARTVAEGMQIIAAYEQDQAGIASRTAGYQRRADEWMLQANLAARELMQIGEQILASLIAEQVAYHDYKTTETQVQQA